MAYYVYLLRCGDGSLYTGYTTDVARRLRQHREGRGAKYTRGRGPLTLVGTLEFATQSEALKAEAWLKTLPPRNKVAVVKLSSPEV